MDDHDALELPIVTEDDYCAYLALHQSPECVSHDERGEPIYFDESVYYDSIRKKYLIFEPEHPYWEEWVDVLLVKAWIFRGWIETMLALRQRTQQEILVKTQALQEVAKANREQDYYREQRRKRTRQLRELRQQGKTKELKALIERKKQDHEEWVAGGPQAQRLTADLRQRELELWQIDECLRPLLNIGKLAGAIRSTEIQGRSSATFSSTVDWINDELEITPFFGLDPVEVHRIVTQAASFAEIPGWNITFHAMRWEPRSVWNAHRRLQEGDYSDLLVNHRACNCEQCARLAMQNRIERIGASTPKLQSDDCADGDGSTNSGVRLLRARL